MFPVRDPDFITISCYKHQYLIRNQKEKDLIIESMRFLVKDGRVIIFGFVLMDNHMHIIWQMNGRHKAGDVQRDFLKYTGQQIIKNMRNECSSKHDKIIVNAVDRKRQVWNKASLKIPLFTSKVFDQKLNYIHWNPVKARLVDAPEDYKYSSAAFYLCNADTWDFLTPAGW